MNESNFSDYWAQAEFCYFRAEATSNPVIKHLWIQLAQDWIALSDNAMPAYDEKKLPAPQATGRAVPGCVSVSVAN